MSDAETPSMIDLIAALQVQVAAVAGAQADLGARLDLQDIMLGSLASRMDAVETGVSLLELRLEMPLEGAGVVSDGEVGGRFDGVDARQDLLVGDLERLAGRVEGAVNQADGLEASLGGVASDVSRALSGVSGLEGQVGGLQAAMGGVDGDFARLGRRIDELEERLGRR